MNCFVRKTPFPILKDRIEKSPFKTIEKVKQSLKKLKNKESIGFSAKNSLIAMGLLKNKDNVYHLSVKYR